MHCWYGWDSCWSLEPLTSKANQVSLSSRQAIHDTCHGTVPSGTGVVGNKGLAVPGREVRVGSYKNVPRE
jgi:hypothetical protein